MSGTKPEDTATALPPPLSPWKIHNLNLRRRFWSLFGGYYGPRTYRIGCNTVLKSGRVIYESEAEAMEYVKRYTTIPLPDLQMTYKGGRWTYIEMSLVSGRPADIVWKYLSDDQRAHILEQLKGYIRQLRALVPPSPSVASANGGPIFDYRLASNRICGPFPTVDDFHYFLRGTNSPIETWADDDFCRSAYISHIEPYHVVKFTHGDLLPRNIMIHKGSISAIIDWDSAGWRPEYWEVTKARYSGHTAPEIWLNAIEEAAGGRWTKQLLGERFLYDVCPSPAYEQIPILPTPTPT